MNILKTIIILMLFTGSLYSQTISKITVRGNKKITADAIKEKLINKEGKVYSEQNIDADIHNIFSLGFFDNVDVYKNADGPLEIIFEVKEKPTISSIIFEGNSDIDTDDLTKQINIKPYTVLNISDVMKSKVMLQKYYEEKGFYLASIKEEVKPATKDKDIDDSDAGFVDVVFKISENSKIKVDKIIILGNKNIPTEELKTIIETKEKGFFSFMSGTGNYRESIVDIDRERIGYYYTIKGYPHVQVFGPITHITADKKWIYLTYTVKEGEKYEFGEINVKADDVVYTDEELRDVLRIKKDNTYNSMEIRGQIEAYQNMYGDKGYAFTNVVPAPTFHDDTKKVDITFEIDKGRKVYFGKFRVIGNNKTRDKVVRRELKVYEGELYNHSKKELSKQKIMALGFFDDVVFNQYVPKDSDAKPDTVNIDIEVKEKSSTGQFMVSAGYSTYEGFITMFQVQENNFLGYGQTLTLRANLSKVSKLYYLSFYDPYFLDSNWGWGVDIFRESREANGFNTVRTGFDTRFSYPLGDFLRSYLTYKLEHTKTAWITSLSNIFDPAVENGFTSSVTGTLENDMRNDRLSPSKGLYNAVSMEVAGFGGNKRFVKTIIDNRFYRPVLWGSIFKTRLLIGNVFSYGGKQLPYSERFLMGGIDSLRGFDYLSLGPIATASDGKPYAVGGSNQILATAELEFPIASEVGIKGVIFFDTGNAFDKYLGFMETDVPIRANWGMGFRWFSPMGPLRFEWGVPINRRTGESATVFQFMIGPSF